MRLPRLHAHGGHKPGHEEVVVPPDTSYTALFNKAFEVVKKQLKVLEPIQRQIIIGTAAVVGVAVVCKAAAHLYTLEQRRRRWQLLRRCEQDGELHLFVLPRAPWSPSLSPACTRVEAYLRANNIPYRAIETVDPTGSPSGELPFLVYKHTRVDRLPRIFDFVTRTFDVTMDGDLTREERALGATLRRTLEYSLEPFLYRTVFLDHPSLAIDQIARGLRVSPLRARMTVLRYAAELRKRLAVTAYGALVSEQYENEFLLDCEALESQIGEKRYLYSDTQLTTYDCAVYSLLVPFAYMGKYTALSTAYMAVSESTVLMAYIGRISRQLFADIGEPFNTSCDTPSASSSRASSVHTEDVHDDVAVSDWESSAQPARTSAVVDPPSTVGGGRRGRPMPAAVAAAIAADQGKSAAPPVQASKTQQKAGKTPAPSH